jgi:general secretion pathway protein K
LKNGYVDFRDRWILVRADRRRQRGIALITVLWVLLLLSALAAGYSRSTRTDALITRNLVEGAQAEALAEAGIYRALAALLDPADDLLLSGGGETVAWTFGGGLIRLVVQDEAGKIDLNAAPGELLTTVFAASGLDDWQASTLADAVADFRDEDGDRRPAGAEDPDYAQGGLAWGAKDAPFVHVDELAQVKGISATLFALLRPSVTVYTNVAEPEDEKATELVRTALKALVSREADRETTTSGVGASSWRDRNDGRSEAGIFTIHAEARTPSGATAVCEAVVKVVPDQAPFYRVLAWRQGRRILFADDEVGRSD